MLNQCLLYTARSFEFDERMFRKSITHFISVDPVLVIDETSAFYIWESQGLSFARFASRS